MSMTMPSASKARAASTSSSSPSSPKVGWPAWMREPLLHFLLLGGVLFGVDHLMVSRADDPMRIVIDMAIGSLQKMERRRTTLRAARRVQ